MAAAAAAVPAAAAAVTRPLRVAWLAIASGGDGYDVMKAVVHEHLGNVPDALDVSPQFVYGTRGDDEPVTRRETEHDRVYDVPESLIPGVLNKTLAALHDLSGAGGDSSTPPPDYVVRTNLSTFFHWDRLAAWLQTAPRRGLAAGYSPDQSHLCGCCMVLSGDVARRLAAYREFNTSLIDDLAIAEALRYLGVPSVWIPRIDILEYGIVGHGGDLGLDPRQAFQVRVKSTTGGEAERTARDPRILANLVRAYRNGVRDTDNLLHASVRGLDTLRRV
jgi:hypothetical protein